MATYIPTGGMSLWQGAPVFWSPPEPQGMRLDKTVRLVASLFRRRRTKIGTTTWTRMFGIYTHHDGGDMRVKFSSTTEDGTGYVRIVDDDGTELYSYFHAVELERVTHTVDLRNLKPWAVLYIEVRSGANTGKVYVGDVYVYCDRIGPQIFVIYNGYEVSSFPPPNTSTTNTRIKDARKPQRLPMRYYSPGIGNGRVIAI